MRSIRRLPLPGARRRGAGGAAHQTRPGLHAWFPELAQLLAELSGGPYVIDGEAACSGGVTPTASTAVKVQDMVRRPRPGHAVRVRPCSIWMDGA